MEYLSGGTLADRIRKGNASPAQIFDWLEQAARALDAAHREGIVHRDVKPANLLFDARGELNVADFGIARVLDQTTVGMTAPGTILGTSGYLSPEQASGDEATAASDIYALGVVAYELMTGSRPFERKSATAEAAAHINDPVPSAAARADLPDEVDEVFERALAKNPATRHSSAGELVEDLQAAMAADEQLTQTIPVQSATATVPAAVAGAGAGYQSPRRSWVLPALVGILLLGGGGVAAAILTGGGDDPVVETQFVPTKIRETVTVEGELSVRTETETIATTVPEEPDEPTEPEDEPPAPPPPPTATAQPPAPPAAAGNGHELNDRGYELQQAGRYGEARPLLEQAVRALQGTYTRDDRYEAYANYNLGYTLLQLGECKDALKYLKRSEQLQGYRAEIVRARNAAKNCG